MKEYCLLFAWPQADETKDKMQYTIHPEAEEVADMKATVGREVGQLSRGGRGSSGQWAGGRGQLSHLLHYSSVGLR